MAWQSPAEPSFVPCRLGDSGSTALGLFALCCFKLVLDEMEDSVEEDPRGRILDSSPKSHMGINWSPDIAPLLLPPGSIFCTDLPQEQIY